MALHCNICKIECSTEQSYQSHLRGKKHQKVVSELEYRKQQAKCSLFVRGFSRQTTEEEMREYFSRFGDVVHVTIEENRDLFAFVEFTGVEAPIVAIRHRKHFIGTQRVTVKQRIFSESNFRPPRSHAATRKGSKGDKSSATNESDDPITFSGVMSALSGATSVLDQMQRLCEHIRMTDEEIKMKRQLCSMLEEVLAPIFPGCTVHQFGSSVNGFGVRGCDADIFLHIKEYEVNPNEKHRFVKLPYMRGIPAFKKSYGPLTCADQVKLVSRILHKHASGCSNIIAIPSARCPVVRFVHDPTGIKCDISINNRIALRNSQLLLLFSCLDDRVRLLVYTIRYWAKVKDIAGSGTKLSNYALTFTIIFFLQNTVPPVLPTVEYLASLVPADAQDVINDWNCSFEKDISRLQPSTNTDAADELLRKYFEFYSDQDFSGMVFQTRTARAKSLVEFLSEYDTSTFKSPFKIGLVSIQDPFVLDHNITGNVNNEKKMKITMEFIIAACKAAKWPKNKLRKRGGGAGGNQGLVDLLSETVPPEITAKCSLPEGKRQSFQVVLKESHLLRKMPASDELASRLDWCGRVIKFAKYLLSDVLLVSVESLSLSTMGETGRESKDVQIDAEMSELASTVCENVVVRGLSVVTGSGNSDTTSVSLSERVRSSKGKRDGSLFSPESKKRHSTTSSDEMDVKKCCYDSQDDSDCENVKRLSLDTLSESENESRKLKVSKQENVECALAVNDSKKLKENSRTEENVRMEIDSQCTDTDEEKPEESTRMETESQCVGLDKDLETSHLAENVKMETDSQCSMINVENNEMQRSQVADSCCFEIDCEKSRQSNEFPTTSPEKREKVFVTERKIDCSVNETGDDISFNKLQKNHSNPFQTSCQQNQDKVPDGERRVDTDCEPVDVDNRKGRKMARNRRTSSADKSRSPKLPRRRSPAKDKNRSTTMQQQPMTKYLSELEALKTEILCRVHCHTWQGRNRVRNSTLARLGSADLSLEKAVSLKIVEKKGQANRALMMFRCRFEPVVALSLCTVNMSVTPVENHSECQAFVTFFKSFVNRMLDRYLNSETLGGSSQAPCCSKDVASLGGEAWPGIETKAPDGPGSNIIAEGMPESPGPSFELKTFGSLKPSTTIKMSGSPGPSFEIKTFGSSQPNIAQKIPGSSRPSFQIKTFGSSEPSVAPEIPGSPGSSGVVREMVDSAGPSCSNIK